MLSKFINLKSFNIKKNKKTIQKKLKFLIKEKNQLNQSLNQTYQDKYDLKKIKGKKNFRLIGMGGSVLGSQAIYNFLREKIKKNFFFINNLVSVTKEIEKKKFTNLIISKSGNTLETISNANILINKKDKNIFISKNKYSDQMYTLKGIPDKYELASAYSISSYTSLLESLKKTDIKLFSDNFKLIKRIKYQTFDGIDVSIDLYNINGDIYSNFSIISDSLIREELAEDEPVIVGLPKMKTYDDIKKEVNKYSYISNWLYKLNDDVNKEFLKPFSALVKKKEANKTKP